MDFIQNAERSVKKWDLSFIDTLISCESIASVSPWIQDAYIVSWVQLVQNVKSIHTSWKKLSRPTVAGCQQQSNWTPDKRHFLWSFIVLKSLFNLQTYTQSCIHKLPVHVHVHAYVSPNNASITRSDITSWGDVTLLHPPRGWLVFKFGNAAQGREAEHRRGGWSILILTLRSEAWD